MSDHQGDANDASSKKSSADNVTKSSKSGLKIVKNEQLPEELLEPEPPAPEFECPVCLQGASFPVQLPCRHIFCFLCVKGVANRSKRCALCRQEIPSDFFNDPKLLCANEIKEKSLSIFDEGYQWFYEGRNGWWQYDERTSLELENRYKQGDKMFELLIAGFLYVIDLENMRQFRRNDQTRRRRIRRDLRNVPGIKGIAGLKFNEDASVRPSGDGGEATQTNPNGGAAVTGNNNDSALSSNQPMILPPGVDGHPSAGDDTYLTPPAPNNTPQTPMTPADSQPGSLSGSQEDLSIHLQHLHINSNNSSRGSPSVDAQDQFRNRYSEQSYPAQTDDGDFDPSDDQHDSDSQQNSIHLNSSNSSTDSAAQASFAQQHCPNRQVHLAHVSNTHDDNSDDNEDSAVTREGINPGTGSYETYL
ncbi:E3 ubiquitin-protein ligase rnf146-like [Mercenaria mercenaria]|uniref:E3 ubiquitin-protein ligase rnf146-like n=1 Tax=Mercenaria mercenaria TaxID=6596 RepID=UPI00234F0365|nr:E3 ubiquitin-protein ligase rnf146-like [Mercenaria mercenaria]